MQTTTFLRPALITCGLLLIPLVAMRFTDEMQWGAEDFVVGGALLFGSGLAFELLVRRMRDWSFRLAAGVTVGTVLLQIWANLAIGIIGSENEPANLMYAVFPLIAIIGGLLARFRPRGMAVTLWTMAGIQVLIIVVALAAGMQHYYGSSVMEIVNVNGFFVVLWTLAAALFQRAAQTER